MNIVRRFFQSLVAVVLVVALLWPLPARAHNEPVHQRMTDYAYHVLLAAARFSDGGPMDARLRARLTRLAMTDARAKSFYDDASKAVPKLRGLKSGLPDDATPCLSGGPPNWTLPPGTTLAELPMAQVRLPVTVDYGHGPASCAIDPNWVPSGVLASVNPGVLPPIPGAGIRRDHTGVTLGYWAAEPDRETKDWVLRSTTVEVLQNPAVVGAIGAGTTVAVATVCALACGFFPIACAVCPFLAVGAGGAVIHEITSIDADSLESKDYVGFGHFVDMKPTPSSPLFFDAKPAKFMQRAGPTGVPDPTEALVTALFDLGGVHVNHDESLAPKNYEIILGPGPIGTDFHRNTIHRDQTQWESPRVPHLQLTAVDNLGMFGYQEARAHKGTAREAYRLGWPLHAIGDAAVPMHTVGASGYGHRPYEDAVDMAYDELVGSGDIGKSLDTVIRVMQRALTWRKFVQDWRAKHQTTEVPVRDLITAVAASTRQKANAQPAVFQPLRSLQYILDQDGATAAYDTPAMAAIQRELLIDGIAASAAFLMSFTEVAP